MFMSYNWLILIHIEIVHRETGLSEVDQNIDVPSTNLIAGSKRFDIKDFFKSNTILAIIFYCNTIKSWRT